MRYMFALFAGARWLVVLVALVLGAAIPSAPVRAQTPALLAVPPANDCGAGSVFADPLTVQYPLDLMYQEWLRVGGPNGPIGCPTQPLETDSDGSVLQFAHGQIGVSPNVWEQGVVAAYQAGNGILVDWTVSTTEPSHFNYSKFVVRWDFNGTHDEDNSDPKQCGRGTGDQCDVLADMTEVQEVLLHYFDDTHLRTKGTFPLPVQHGNGEYKISIEGCDEGGVGGSTCRQGWMHAVQVSLQPPATDPDYPIDLTGVPTSFDGASSRGNFAARAAAITLYNACRLLPWTSYRNEEGYMTVVLAKLDYANYFQQDNCPGRPISNRQEAIASLAAQEVGSAAGTTIDSCPGCRTGDYDVALSGYMVILHRFGGVLPDAVYQHILNDLLNKHGSLNEGDHFVDVEVPESENHINMIESARYLTNDLLFARAGDAQYDNRNNGFIQGGSDGPLVVPSMRDLWLQRLQRVLQTDFIEYNARPYTGYTTRAIQNLYSYAQDPEVKTAAKMVLDYVSAKVATSSSDGRRAVPYRRKAEYNSPGLVTVHADPEFARMLALAGDLQVLPPSPKGGFLGPWYGQDDMQLAIESAYRIPDHILDMLFDSDQRVFFQGFHHYADELYAGSPSYLISAGGHYASSAYKVEGIFGKGDDIGMALPTTVMPTGEFVTRDVLIRFDGNGDDTRRSNMCVAPNFACGINPQLPAEVSAASLQAGCVVDDAPWTFINFTSACRTGGRILDTGFFAAMYQRSDLLGVNQEPFFTGFVELLDKKVHPEIAFDDFRTGVLARNQNRTYGALAFSNEYVTSSGQEIDFALAPDSRILSIDGQPPLPDGSTLASGSILHADTLGRLVIENPINHQQLVLDAREASIPQEYTLVPTDRSGPPEFGLGYRCIDGVGSVAYGVINPTGNPLQTIETNSPDGTPLPAIQLEAGQSWFMTATAADGTDLDVTLTVNGQVTQKLYPGTSIVHCS